MTRVKSTDPRKPAVLDAFKRQCEGVSKVTDVMDLGDGKFQATCHRHLGNRKYLRLGVYSVTVSFGEAPNV